MKYETIVGLEIHAQLKTNTKMFCNCDNNSSDVPPNTNICPVCMGFPGSLPVPNRKAMEWTFLLGLALDAEISESFQFERKNYFYPDLPKAYQITSSSNPPLKGGSLEVENKEETRNVRLHHIHIEEDAGKLIHKEGGEASLVDLNRAGTPLLEIVTEADIRSGEEAKIFLQDFRSMLRHLDISDANMEEGNLRCDVNISVKEVEDKKLGTKVEVKNLNSFKMVERAVDFEAKRQIETLSNNEKIIQETRGWNDEKSKSYSQRTKEEAHDYRYFPEPDIPKIVTKKRVNNFFDLNEIKKLLPELPREKYERFLKEYELDKRNAHLLSGTLEIGNFFEKTISHIEKAAESSASKKKYAKLTANWITGELSGKMNEASLSLEKIKIKPENMAELMLSLYNEEITGKSAKEVLEEMFESGKSAQIIIKEKDLKQISNESDLEVIIEKVITENPQVVEDYKSGKKKALGYLIGQVMKETGGQANPKLVNNLFSKKLQK